MANEQKWCFTWAPNQDQAGASGGANRAALLRDAKWPSGTLITVSFLDGSEAVQAKVWNYAEEWTQPGLAKSLSFDFQNGTNDTDIRISFQYEGSWSVLGRYCRQIADKTQPTMNYGWLTPQTPENEIRQVVLHEFGHALGLIHEHQNPKGGIKWNRPNVIEDLSGPPNNWSPEQIEFNMFQKFELAEVQATPVDEDSIMLYPIPPHWTLDGFSADLNSDLSVEDRRLIHEAYL